MYVVSACQPLVLDVFGIDGSLGEEAWIFGPRDAGA
jgi:hypothetical protein